MKAKILVLAILSSMTLLANAQTAIVDKNKGTIKIGTVYTTAEVVDVNGNPGTNGAIAIGGDPTFQFQTKAINGGIAIGVGAQAIGANSSVAIAPYSVVTAAFGVGIGSNTTCSGSLCTAIGPQATVTTSNSVAIGALSETTRDNEFSIGSEGKERLLANVKKGYLPTDATNVEQVLEERDNAINYSTQYSDRKNLITNQRIDLLDNKVNSFDSRIRTLDNRLDKIGALAMASSALAPNPHVASNNQYALGLGNYNGANAIAGALYHYSDDKKRQYNVRMSISGGERGIGVGFASGF